MQKRDPKRAISAASARPARHGLALALICALALAIRLAAWRWHAAYPLGGDEREYLDQAVRLLRDHQYVELRLMRPPLYTLFLAGCIQLFDSLVANLRLAQAVLSALSVLPIYALARALYGPRPALLAALLAALDYTLALSAAELLTETLFLAGLATGMWLLAAAGIRLSSGATQQLRRGVRLAALAGLTIGALCLVRSVALPLLPLGALWLLLARQSGSAQPHSRTAANRESRAMSSFSMLVHAMSVARVRPLVMPRLRLPMEQLLHSIHVPEATGQAPGPQAAGRQPPAASQRLVPGLAFLLAAALVILPWTARNYVTYGAVILIDTTGAENLWLDNDPAGREDVKRQLYALGEDRAERQRLAMQRGLAAIGSDLPRFLAKARGEALKFFALQHFDDLRDRPAIYAPPAEVWLRLLLGDALWLLVMLGGVAGLWLVPGGPGHARRWALIVAIPWALYTLLTAVLFHVELRYRLPLLPALLPYAAALLGMPRPAGSDTGTTRGRAATRLAATGGLLTALALLGATLLHRPYIHEGLTLASKHRALARAEQALAQADSVAARSAASLALGYDDRSALARVALARTALLEGSPAEARQILDAATRAIAGHPHPHLLRGALRLTQGDREGARADLAYESGSLEDLQSWAWRVFPIALPPAGLIDVGGGLDLGSLRGFYLAEPAGFRWTTGRAELRLRPPPAAASLVLRVAANRPPAAPPARLTVSAGGRTLATIALAGGWQTVEIPVGPELAGADGLVIELDSDTFQQRDYDPASDDGRTLGIMVDWAEVRP